MKRFFTILLLCLFSTILFAGGAPHLVYIFEVGSQLALDVGTFDTADYIQPVLNYYTLNRTVNSIPFNSSPPILYSNKYMMAQAGLDSEYSPASGKQGDLFSDIQGLSGWIWRQQ